MCCSSNGKHVLPLRAFSHQHLLHNKTYNLECNGTHICNKKETHFTLAAFIKTWINRLEVRIWSRWSGIESIWLGQGWFLPHLPANISRSLAKQVIFSYFFYVAQQYLWQQDRQSLNFLCAPPQSVCGCVCGCMWLKKHCGKVLVRFSEIMLY